MLKICRKKFCSSVSRFDLIEQCPTSTHPAEKNNSCMHCMPMILLFVQAPFLLLTLFVAIILRTVFCFFFFFIALFGSFVQLNLLHSSFSPLIKISFKSYTMLFSTLFDFQANIYITVCFNLNSFPILESSPLFFSLTL